MVAQVSSTTNGSFFAILQTDGARELIKQIALAAISSTAFATACQTLDCTATNGALVTSFISAGLLYDCLTGQRTRAEPDTNDLLLLAEKVKWDPCSYVRQLIDTLREADAKGLSAVTLQLDHAGRPEYTIDMSIKQLKAEVVRRLRDRLHFHCIEFAEQLAVPRDEWQRGYRAVEGSLVWAGAVDYPSVSGDNVPELLQRKADLHWELIDLVKAYVLQKYHVAL